MSLPNAVLFLLLIGGGVAPVAAQTDSAKTDGSSSLHEILDSAAPIPALADELVNSLGRLWTEVRMDLPPPDSSAMDEDFGDLWWSVPEAPVDGFRAFVQRGRVESVTLDFSPAGPDIAMFARRLYDRLGSPRPDGFYATDQTGYPFSLAVDAQANRLTARVVPGQLVTD